MSLYHLTLNTGHVAHTERAEVAESVIALLRPLVLAGSGSVPGPEPIWLEVERHPGRAEFHLASGPAGMGVPYLVAVGCWWLQSAEAATATLRARAQTAGVAPPSTTLPVPWLAVALLPSVVLLSRATVELLADLERCVLWTLTTMRAD